MDYFAGTYNYSKCDGRDILVGPVGGDPHAQFGLVGNCPVGRSLVATGFDQFNSAQGANGEFENLYDLFVTCVKS